MTLEEFKEIKKKILDDIKTRQRKCEDENWGVYYSIEISGVLELARAVEKKFKEEKE